MRRCREKGGCAGHMDQTVRDILNQVLPTDAAQRCNGNFFAGVTVLQDSLPRSPLASVVDSWTDRNDLISTLAASAYIPIWSGSRLFTRWRGKDTADGSLSIDQPCPPGVEYCVRIASRAPGTRPQTMGDLIGAIARALAGLPAAAARMVKPILPDSPPQIAPWRLAAMRAAGLDIAPGLSVSNSVFDTSTWTEVRAQPAGRVLAMREGCLPCRLPATGQGCVRRPWAGGSGDSSCLKHAALARPVGAARGQQGVTPVRNSILDALRYKAACSLLEQPAVVTWATGSRLVPQHSRQIRSLPGTA